MTTDRYIDQFNGRDYDVHRIAPERLLPTRIAEVDIGPDCIVILGPEQDDDGHTEVLTHW